MNDDELLARLRAADPAAGTDAPDPWVDEMAEATMRENDQLTTPLTTIESGRRRARWPLAAAAAAVVALGATGVLLSGAGDEPAPPSARPAQVMTLGLPASDAMGSCLAFSVDVLRPMEVAFSGTATVVESKAVTLRVDRWYKGGDGSQLVKLATLDGAVALEGGVEFEEGRRYLITATGGTVNSCGYSSEWTPEMESAFDEAFGK